MRNDRQGDPEMGDYQPAIGEIVRAKAFRTGRWYTGAFKRHTNLPGQSTLNLPGNGGRVYVISATIEPIEEKP